MFFFFFFSSRRRHTRYWRDWSSDVCSSDLGVVENSASAVAAAVAGRYGIEVDLQASADGEAMVHHDDALGRLTEGRANLAELNAAELQRVPFRATTDRMMTLGDLCDLVGG